MDTDRPISKPSFPLPMAFHPSKLGEMPTLQRQEHDLKNQRAYFYRKATVGSAAVYDFYITENTEVDGSH